LAACDSEVNERTYERSTHYYPGVAAHRGFADMALQLRLGILPEWRIRFDSGHRVNRFSTKITGTEFQKERHRFGAPPVFQFLNRRRSHAPRDLNANLLMTEAKGTQ